ncbi:MAG: type II secretion system protein [Phycisphaerales bacterium]|nr:type II secretion system protein [Phycisphaerales bacterium]
MMLFTAVAKQGSTCMYLKYKKTPRAFTIIETLVVLGIIAILASITIVAISGASETATQARSTDALRQMASGYTQSSSDNNGELMPGYSAPSDYANAADMPIELEAKVDGRQINPEDAASYVWRLAPYMGGGYKTFMADYRDSAVLDLMDAEVANNVYGSGSASASEIGVGLRPSFGLNSIALGGDSRHGGLAKRYHPWGSRYASERLAATRLSEVVQPSRMILFASSHDPDANLGAVPGTKWGYMELRPPGAGDFERSTVDGDDAPANPWEFDQWWFDENGQIVDSGSGNLGTAGIPVSRGKKQGLPLVHLDGATSVELVGTIAHDPWSWMPFGPSKPRR